MPCRYNSFKVPRNSSTSSLPASRKICQINEGNRLGCSKTKITLFLLLLQLFPCSILQILFIRRGLKNSTYDATRRDGHRVYAVNGSCGWCCRSDSSFLPFSWTHAALNTAEQKRTDDTPPTAQVLDWMAQLISFFRVCFQSPGMCFPSKLAKRLFSGISGRFTGLSLVTVQRVPVQLRGCLRVFECASPISFRFSYIYYIKCSPHHHRPPLHLLPSSVYTRIKLIPPLKIPKNG